MSIRDQERRQREAERRIDQRMRRADAEIKTRIEQRAREATLRAQEVVRRIEKGDVQPRPLPGLREDSVASMESMESMESAESMKSMPSAGYVSEATANADAGMMEDMPLQGVMPIDPAEAEEDLAQRVTEDTGAGGDPHLHNERRAEQMTKEMTEDTGAEGDMNLHAERKVDEMFEE
jgi:hypothetical protein